MDNHRIDLNLAHVFTALWEERSVTRAAQRLHLSQAAVSAALSRLRTVCNDPLFQRTPQGMQPTAHAQDIAGELADSLGRLHGALAARGAFVPAQSRRRFTLGMSDDFELAFGPPLVDALLRDAPHASLIFRQSNRHAVQGMLERREIDVALVSGSTAAAGLVQDVLGESGYSGLLDTRVAQAPTTLDGYLALPHVLVSYSGQVGIVDTALQTLGRQRRLLAALVHFAALPAFLTGRAAIATLPSHAAQALAGCSHLHTCALPPDLQLGRYPVSMLQRRDTQHVPALQWLTDRIRETVTAALLTQA